VGKPWTLLVGIVSGDQLWTLKEIMPPTWIGLRVGRLALALAFSCLPARAEPDRTIRAGSQVGFPLYVDVDAQGRPTGFAVDLFSAVAAAMGMRVTFRVDLWDTVWQALEAGELDALPLVARMAEREGQVEFTRPHTIGYDSFLGKFKQTTQKSHRISIAELPETHISRLLDAIADTGLHGETGNAHLAMRAERDIPAGKVRRLKVSGIHNCCRLCCEAIRGKVRSQPCTA
jgi:hypothetical protein